jgi:hypothetical protein
MATQTTNPKGHHQSFWLWVMCLTGVDYFSTLGYQPSIAFENAGLLAPLATVVLVAVTLFGALPVYAHVARKSPHGQGSIAMLERLVHGWAGKSLVLVLLGFAATDFVITKTLSAADAAEHLIANPFWPFPSGLHPEMDRQRIILTMILLVILGAMFMRGFREVIGLAVVLVAVYLALNAVIIGSGLVYLLEHPQRLESWYQKVFVEGEWHLRETPLPGHGTWTIVILSLLFFPKLALGLSGFETGVAVMPLIKGRPDDDPHQPVGRIRNARKLLITAALIMSVCLLGSALVISTVIKPTAFVGDEGGVPDQKPPAKDRALAYIAHGEHEPGYENINPVLFGRVFGTLYDISTVVILWFAGASAMAGLLNLAPQYLPRYGMAPDWARAVRPLVILFTAINLFVTWFFNASVSAQGGAYATGVLVLMSSACVATVIDRWRDRSGHWLLRTPWLALGITAVFLYTTVTVMIEKPDGLRIAVWFIAAIVVSSIISRLSRATELRFSGFQFKDEQSRFLWDSMKFLEFPVIVPHRPSGRALHFKEETIRKEHRLTPDVPVVFLEAELGDASDFYQEPLMEVMRKGERIVVRVTRCASIAHVIAAVALELSKVGQPPEIHFGWSEESPIAANLGFLIFGEGNVPWLVRGLIRRAQPDPEKQPRVIIG